MTSDYQVISIRTQGFEWPSTLGAYTLMGPINKLGPWRWYERQFDGMTQRIKVDSQLRAIDLKGFCND